MIAQLEEAGRVLAKYGCERELSVVQSLRQLHDSDEPAFAHRIRGSEIWGGEGAVWGAALDFRIRPWDEMHDDLRRFRAAVVGIAEALETRGLGTERSREIAAAVRLWIDQDYPQGGRYVRPTVPPDLEAEITLLATRDGGRPGPVCSGFFPSHILDPEIGMCGAQHEYPDDYWLFPGHRARALLRFLSPEVHRGRLFAGMTFRVHEGAEISGQGRILRVLNRALERAV